MERRGKELKRLNSNLPANQNTPQNRGRNEVDIALLPDAIAHFQAPPQGKLEG